MLWHFDIVSPLARHAFVDVVACTDPLVGIEWRVAGELAHIAHLQQDKNSNKFHTSRRWATAKTKQGENMGEFDHISPTAPNSWNIAMLAGESSSSKQPLFFLCHVTENDALHPDLDVKIIAKGVENMVYT